MTHIGTSLAHIIVNPEVVTYFILLHNINDKDCLIKFTDELSDIKFLRKYGRRYVVDYVVKMNDFINIADYLDELMTFPIHIVNSYNITDFRKCIINRLLDALSTEQLDTNNKDKIMKIINIINKMKKYQNINDTKEQIQNVKTSWYIEMIKKKWLNEA